MAIRHGARRPDLDEKIKPPEDLDPEEALRRILNGQGSTPEDLEPEDDDET